jgi:HSP20 family protein
MRKLLSRLSGFDKSSNINLQDEELMNEEEEYEEEYEDELEESDEIEEAEEEGKEGLGDEYEEGQLSIDVFQTPKNIVVKSTIAGVKPGDIDISINNDMLTIRGKRETDESIKETDYLFRECYWGSFSRSVILPVEVQADKIEAELENGVLTVTLPKARPAKQISIKVKER